MKFGDPGKAGWYLDIGWRAFVVASPRRVVSVHLGMWTRDEWGWSLTLLIIGIESEKRDLSIGVLEAETNRGRFAVHLASHWAGA